MVFIKIGNFTIFFILGKQRKQKVFCYILETENALLDHNNNKVKNPKNWRFSKGVHGFDQNWQFFHLSILGKKRPKKVF